MIRAAESQSTLERRPSLAARLSEEAWTGALVVATGLGLVALVVLLITVFQEGAGEVDGPFIRNFASRIPERAGIWPPLVGTVFLMGLVAAASFPIGVGAAVYLEEFAPKNRFTSLIETNIVNLAAVPSIIYGLLGLALFYRALALGASLLTGALTLSLLILPIIIISAREALRAVPRSVRTGALALGATPWEAVFHQVIPAAIPGIMTGTILGLSRAIGETAPLLVAGAAAFVAFTPDHLLDAYSALPIQIFDWVRRPQGDFRALAGGAIVVLLAVLLTMNLVAILIRNRYER